MKESLDSTTRVLTTSVEKCTKDLDRLKFDLHEMLEQRTDTMNRMFDTELLTVRKRYTEACQGVEEAKDSVNRVFKLKVRSIKEKSAVFFAKLEMKLEENNTDVVAISKMFKNWQETM